MKYSGWTIGHRLWECIQIIYVLHTFLSSNLSFPSLSPVTSLTMPTNNGPVLMDFTFGLPEQFQNYAWCGIFQNYHPHSQHYCVQLNVVIDIDNYLDTYHLTPWHLNLAVIQHTIDMICLASLWMGRKRGFTELCDLFEKF